MALLLATLYAPAAWRAAVAGGRALLPVLGGTDPLVLLAAATAVVALVAAAGARRAGVLRTSAPEVEFLLRGAFPARAVLGRGALRSLVTAAAAGAAVVAALGTGAGVAAGALPLAATATAGAAAGAVGW
ncbi:hypothetical protein GTR02_22135, partial [Kineococcus sp. R8]|uniref:hypothetical protein n=1 Tax=Kineococcus siccus TaxID=2696567 RepID=UPI00196A62E1